MDINAISKSQYLLNDKWNLYYHLPHDKKWDLTSYKLIIGNIDNAEKLIAINETLPENVVKNCMLFVMRDGITPMCEDKKNRNGGCFSFKVPNKQVMLVWRSLFYSICGETLCIEKNHNQFINGITVSPKRNFCIIKVWLRDCSLQDPNILIDITNLSKTGCLFKKHEPEF
jgi:hypothetical protein